MSSPPLANVRVIEIGTMISAPFAALQLAELGAEVIKVERPSGGDPFRGHSEGSDGPHFRAFNKNKKSITLDLNTEEGIGKFKALLDGAHVLIDNFRPGAMDRLGLSQDVLAAVNPRLIHASITGFGRDGPYALRAAYDTVAQALSGMTSMFVDDANPHLGGPTISDNVAGMYAVQGILAALFDGNRGNTIKRVEVNMLETSIAFISDSFALAGDGVEINRFSRVRNSQSFVVNCSDGGRIAIHLSSPTKFWDDLVRVIERPDLASDDRFAERAARVRNFEMLQDELNAVFMQHPRREWLERLSTSDVPFASVLKVNEVANDVQVQHLSTFYWQEDHDHRIRRYINTPILIDGVRSADRCPPPLLGQHNDEILRQQEQSDKKRVG